MGMNLISPDTHPPKAPQQQCFSTSVLLSLEERGAENQCGQSTIIWKEGMEGVCHCRHYSYCLHAPAR